MTTEEQEREKLLLARAEIAEVLTRHALIGHVVLCAQLGRAEALMHVTAPWSGLRMESTPDGEGQMMRLRSKRQDYQGSPGKQKQDLESTLGALSSMGELTGMAAMALLDASREFDEATEAKHTPLRRDSGGMQ